MAARGVLLGPTKKNKVMGTYPLLSHRANTAVNRIGLITRRLLIAIQFTMKDTFPTRCLLQVTFSHDALMLQYVRGSVAKISTA